MMAIIPNDRAEDVFPPANSNTEYTPDFLSGCIQLLKLRWKVISVKSSKPLAQVTQIPERANAILHATPLVAILTTT